jgi:hypothetical protein
MTVTPTSFRANFAEFANTTTYPDSMINFWLGVGGRLLNPNSWGCQLDDGMSLFVAHEITLAGQAVVDTSVGGMPGQKSNVSGKTVDKVTVSYDVNASVEANAGHYNLTTYGKQFIHLARLLGEGGMQITGCAVPILPGGFPWFPWS